MRCFSAYGNSDRSIPIIGIFRKNNEEGTLIRHAFLSLRARRSWALRIWISSGGRPGRIILPPLLISARSSISSVSSGASSGSTHGLRLAEPPDFCFFGMAIPHREDAAGLVRNQDRWMRELSSRMTQNVQLLTRLQVPLSGALGDPPSFASSAAM